MNFNITSPSRAHDAKFECYRIRLMARLCVVLVCFVQFLSRIITVNRVIHDTSSRRYLAIACLVYAPMMVLIVGIEYLMFKKKGPRALTLSLWQFQKESLKLQRKLLLFFVQHNKGFPEMGHTTAEIILFVNATIKFNDNLDLCDEKKEGRTLVKRLRHSTIVDLVVLFLLIADWISGIFISLAWVKNHDPVLFPISTMTAFTTFGWRTLIVILVVQKWQLKIIAPIIAIVVVTAMAIHYDPSTTILSIIRGAAQIFNIVFIIYCEDKIKWMMIWNNIQQEKWMQVNNFILNNIPENIMILDMKGETKFVSDYCKSFIEKLSLEAKDLFGKIKDLQQQEQENGSVPSDNHIENLPTQAIRLVTDDAMFTETVNQQNNANWLKVEVLTELITNFKIVIAEKNLQERQFLVYNGKLHHQQARSIEVKISFIHQFENEYIILILRDTTQRDLLITLEETNKYKDQLLASVSHELRTPLNGNINLVEAAVNSKKVPENIKDTLLIPALRSSKFLLHLINDILDMSQIKEKKLRLTFQSGDLLETLKSTAQLVELQAKKKGVELVLKFDPKLPQNFSTDHVRVSQIVLNLLNNALKFTKEGSVKLIAEPMIPNLDWVKITIEDSGIGMSPENIKKLFSNYTHIEFEGRQSINPTGVGLGLNIASNLVKLLAPIEHQTIEVESVPDQGSTFSFILEDQQKGPIQLKELDDSKNSSFKIADELLVDRKPTLSSLPSTSQIEPLLDQCSCPKILVVDDNPFNTMAFETILSSLNMKCDSVYSGSSAIEKLLQRETKKCCSDCKGYSVVFMDQEMPEMDGIDTTKEIRRLQGKNLLPQDLRVIGCTAHHSKEETDKFLEAGLDKCIYKPISAAIVANIL